MTSRSRQAAMQKMKFSVKYKIFERFYISSHIYSFSGDDMNKFYKIIWSNILQNWVVVSELSTSTKKKVSVSLWG